MEFKSGRNLFRNVILVQQWATNHFPVDKEVFLFPVFQQVSLKIASLYSLNTPKIRFEKQKIDYNYQIGPDQLDIFCKMTKDWLWVTSSKVDS